MNDTRRVPQLRDDVIVTVTFPPETEEWADELIRESWMNMDVTRDADDALVVVAQVGGNTNGVSVLQSVLSEIEDALQGGEVDPMEFTISVRAGASS